MTNVTLEVMEKDEVPSVPASGKRSAKGTRRRKPQVDPSESMARLWAESALEELGALCDNLGQTCQIETAAAGAVLLLQHAEGEELMSWLRWRTTWEDESQLDGTKVCCDMFALPIRGAPHRVAEFLASGRMCEQLVSVLRQSYLASSSSDFVFLPIALPLMTAASLTLDGISNLRSSLTSASQGGKRLNLLARKLQESFEASTTEDECVLLGIRLVQLHDKDEPEDIFRVGITDADGGRCLMNWGKVAGEVSSRLGFFLGFPQDVPDAVAFLAAFRANGMLDRYPGGPVEDYTIHACHVEDGLLISRACELDIAGPVLIPAALASCCEEILMDGISEKALDVVWHSKPTRMPGLKMDRAKVH